MRKQVKQKERRANALAPGAEEGRDKLRKAAGRSTYPSIRRYPNGETRIDRLYAACTEYIGVRGEPSEIGRGQTVVRALRGSDCDIDFRG